MNIVLLSGGSGKRLWPLSNDARSKQFLKVLRAKKGKHESMLQRVYGQIKQAILNPVITIVTSSIQSDSIHQQTDEDINLVFEPERRNTFAAILLACADLYYNKNVDRDDVIIVAPIDPYAETSFFAQFNALEKATQDNAGDLVLMGVSPTYPAAKYGYIVPEKSIMENMDSQRVACFKEKPSEMEAEALISQGALWNCGIFAFKLGYVLDILRQHMQVSTYAQVVEGYANLPKNSFDYEVVERASSVAVVKYEGAWKDLGTWNTLAEELSEENSGIVLRDDTTINTHIH